MSAALSSAASLGATPTPGTRLASDAARTLGRFLFGSTGGSCGWAGAGRTATAARDLGANGQYADLYGAEWRGGNETETHEAERKRDLPFAARAPHGARTPARQRRSQRPLFSCLILNLYAQLTIDEAADALFTPRCGADVSRAGPSSRRTVRLGSLGVGDTLKTREASTFISLYTKSEHCCYPLLLRLC